MEGPRKPFCVLDVFNASVIVFEYVDYLGSMHTSSLGIQQKAKIICLHLVWCLTMSGEDILLFKDPYIQKLWVGPAQSIWELNLLLVDVCPNLTMTISASEYILGRRKEQGKYNREETC